MARHTVTLIPGTASATRSAPRPAGSSTRPGGHRVEVHDAGLDVIEKYASRCLRTSWTHPQEPGRHQRPLTTPVGRACGASTSRCAGSLTSTPGRPCKSYPGVRSRYQDIDLVIIRENTEDLYAGIEFQEGSRRPSS